MQFINTFHVTNVKNYRNKWTYHEPHAKTHIGEKHLLVLTRFFSTVASHMLIQATVWMESFVTLGTFLQRLLKSGVFAPSVGSILVINIPHYLNDFWHRAQFINIFHVTNVKNYRNKWTSHEPQAKMHIGEKYLVVQISPDMVFLHGGQSYAHSSNSFDGIICHNGYIFTAPSKIGCLCPQCGKHMRDQQSTLPEWFLTESAFYRYFPCDKCEKIIEINKHLMNHMQNCILERST